MSRFEVRLEEVGSPSDAGPDATQEPDDPTLHTLDVDQPCRLRPASFARLREAPTSELVLAGTRERADLLHGLSRRRDPEGWPLARQRPRATGDPRRYLRRTPVG